MASAPSIKGSVFGSVVEDVGKVLERGDLSRDEAARWLQPEDFALLGSNILVSAWYDIGSYTRMSLLMRDVVGDGDNEYLRQCGRKTARRLLEAGMYAQLEYLHRTELRHATTGPARFEAFGRDLRKLTTLSGSILNFSRWASKPDPDRAERYLIEVTEARDVPEVLCWRSDGFVNEMASQHDQPDLWRWERPSSDTVLFRMVRSV